MKWILRNVNALNDRGITIVCIYYPPGNDSTEIHTILGWIRKSTINRAPFMLQHSFFLHHIIMHVCHISQRRVVMPIISDHRYARHVFNIDRRLIGNSTLRAWSQMARECLRLWKFQFHFQGIYCRWMKFSISLIPTLMAARSIPPSHPILR